MVNDLAKATAEHLVKLLEAEGFQCRVNVMIGVTVC